MAIAPLTDRDFAQRMAAVGPFGARPHLAVGVSGGGDSLALTLLLQRWCRRRGGQLLALTVEHGLRPESAGEARRLGRQLKSLGIPHRLLPWQGLKPAGAFEAAARTARYTLLQAACRRAGILHLAVAHHADDQAETLQLRAAAGSGPSGLAGMAAVTPLRDVLLLRPLLDVPHQRLLATCRAAGLAWSEDPGNSDPASGRRAALRLASRRRDRSRLLGAAERQGQARRVVEASSARLLGQGVAWHPIGYARLIATLWVAAPPAVAVQALGELLRALGGTAFVPSPAATAAALNRLGAPVPRGFTLGGCRLVPGHGGWLVAREDTAAPITLQPGETGLWDGRWAWRLAPRAPSGLALGPLCRPGWQVLATTLSPAPLPGPALWSLPAISDAGGLLAVPALGWRRSRAALAGLALHFAPNPPGIAGFTVACRQRHII